MTRQYHSARSPSAVHFLWRPGAPASFDRRLVPQIACGAALDGEDRSRFTSQEKDVTCDACRMSFLFRESRRRLHG